MGVSLKNPIFRGPTCSQNNVSGDIGQFADFRGAWSKREGGVFEGGWYSNEHYVIFC